MISSLSLAPGSRLGPHEIVAPIGKGGMGEVYRARDTRLGREVAIKLLPEELTRDPERRARFEREARVLASLNHPHIATLFGFERYGESDVLVMELVPGETLADRIARGPISIDEAIPVFLQIAEGLEAAHEKGIVHRDLKPANVKLGADGASVKILDFGLAKAMAPEDSAAREAMAADGAAPGALTQSPTLTLKPTRRGEILGTSQYMSPEQARGLPVDRRTDVWAFGVCLYEALTGRPPFEGEDVSSILAAVIRDEPRIEALPDTTPAALRDVVRRCLAKRPKDRLHDIGDAAIELREMLERRGGAGADRVGEMSALGHAGSTRARWRWRAAIVVAAALGAVIAWIVKPERGDARPTARSVVSSALHLPNTGLGMSGSSVAVSRDGGAVAWIGEPGKPWSINVRRLDQLEARSLDNSEGAVSPTFSPGGDWIAFARNRSLEKVSIAGGAPVHISGETPFDVMGLAWGDDEHLYYGSSSGLYRVSAAGGEPELLATPDDANEESAVAFPDLLPGGRTVLATLWHPQGAASSEIVAIDVATRERKVVLRSAGQAYFVAPKYLVYAVGGGKLSAVMFDPEALRIGGEPTTIAEGVATTGTSPVGAFGGSRRGSVAYVGGGSALDSLVWLDRAGRTLKRLSLESDCFYPRFSPDGRLLAIPRVANGDQSLWVLSLNDGAWLRLGPPRQAHGIENYPVWTSDGRDIFYAAGLVGQTRLMRRAADGSKNAEALIDEPNAWSQSLSPDGRLLVYRVGTFSSYDLRVLDLDTRKSRPLLAGPADELNGEISPDGRWLAYESNESGRREVWVRPFPDVDAGGHWQVSTDGGTEPRWSIDGRELFFRSNERMMAAPVEERTTSFRRGLAVELFRGRYRTSVGRYYDVTPDGRTFLMVEDGVAPGEDYPNVVLIQNLDEELKRRLPAQ